MTVERRRSWAETEEEECKECKRLGCGKRLARSRWCREPVLTRNAGCERRRLLPTTGVVERAEGSRVMSSWLRRQP